MTLHAIARQRSNAEKRTVAERVLTAMMPSMAKTHDSGNEAGTDTLCTLAEADAYTVMGYGGRGFAIIANDDAYDAVIGYSDSSFPSDVEAQAPALSWYLEAAGKTMTAGEKRQAVAIPDGCKASVEHMVTTKWNQEEPYNNRCPQNTYSRRCYTGCVATAMAQVMRYYAYPTRGTGTRDTVYFNDKPYAVTFSTAYDWDNMLPTYDAGAYTATQALAVSVLMYHCGVASHMDYSITGSGTYLNDAARGMSRHFGYVTQYYGYRDGFHGQGYSDGDWMTAVYRELSGGHPIIYSGTSYKHGYDNGSSHAFVLDGYDAEGNVGVNWGYSGLGDGYYNLDLLPLNAGGIDEEYSYWQDMVFVRTGGTIDYDLQPAAVRGIAAPDADDGMVRVYDTTGREVYASPKASFSVSDIPAKGFYILKQGTRVVKLRVSS